jgi:hypothetical protein
VARAFRILILFLFIKSFLIGSPGDSIIKFSDLKFRNETEKTILSSYSLYGKKSDVVDLFLTHFKNSGTYSSSSAHSQLKECVADLKKETEGQDDQKKVKTIYKHVHKRFFKLYQMQNSLTDVFEKGEYNCVSGSAMYAMVFHFMNIPFQIVEAPHHVFLFAYPGSHKIAIETTDPQKGYFPFGTAYVERFVQRLYQSKLISKEEFETKSMNDLFEKYYFSPKGLDLQELAAIQYANYAAYHLDQNENEKSLEEIKKAYFIDPSERNKYILTSLLINVLRNKNYKEQSDNEVLAILCRYNSIDKKEITDEYIKYEFSRLTQEQLINNSNYTQYENSFNKIIPSVTDTVLNDELTFIYHYELARLGISNFKDRNYVFPHLKGAYAAKPAHADLQLMILSYFVKQAENLNDPPSILTMMNDYNKAFPFLSENRGFYTIKANCLLEQAYQSLSLKEMAKGEKYLEDFQKLMEAKKDAAPGEKFVEKAYSTAATYYYKKGNVAKTREFLRTGIKYAPENFGLRMRLEQVK